MKSRTLLLLCILGSLVISFTYGEIISVSTDDDDPMYEEYESDHDPSELSTFDDEEEYEEYEDEYEDDEEEDDWNEDDDPDDPVDDAEDPDDASEENLVDIEDLKRDLKKTREFQRRRRNEENEEVDAFIDFEPEDFGRYRAILETEREIEELRRQIEIDDEYFEQMDDDEIDIVIMDESREEMVQTMVDTVFTVEINDKVGLDGKKWQIYNLPEGGEIQLLNPEETYVYKHELYPSQFDKDDRSVRYRFKLKSTKLGLYELSIVYGKKHDLDLYRERHRGTLKDGRISRVFPKKELLIRVVDRFEYQDDGLHADDLAWAHEELMYHEDL